MFRWAEQGGSGVMRYLLREILQSQDAVLSALKLRPEFFAAACTSLFKWEGLRLSEICLPVGGMLTASSDVCRRWVLLHLLQKAPPADQNQTDAERSRHLSEQLAQTLHEEMKVCADAACRYPSNYNAWSHRIWVLQRLAKGNVKVGPFPPILWFCLTR